MNTSSVLTRRSSVAVNHWPVAIPPSCQHSAAIVDLTIEAPPRSGAALQFTSPACALFVRGRE